MARMSPYVFDESFTAAADLSALQYRVVKLTAADTMNVVAAATDVPLGILLDVPTSGDVGMVRLLGWCDAYAKGQSTNIAVNDPVGSDASGFIVKKATAGDMCIGYAMDACTVDSVLIRVRLTAPFVYAVATG